jgi:protein-disulfide isomerase
MKKGNWPLVIIILVIIAFIIGYGRNVIVRNQKAKENINSICQGRTLQNKEITDIKPLGTANAPILLEVYSDYQCPACANYYVNTIKQVEKDYVDTGKVKLVYKDIAVEKKDISDLEAQAAHCANDQGKFWEYHDKLMTLRSQTSDPNVYTRYNLEDIAKDTGLDECEFDLCLESGKYTQLVESDTKEAIKQIHTIPTSYLNGTMITDTDGNAVGAMSYSSLKTMLDKVLSSNN